MSLKYQSAPELQGEGIIRGLRTRWSSLAPVMTMVGRVGRR